MKISETKTKGFIMNKTLILSGAAIALSLFAGSAMAQENVINVCTAKKGGNYEYTGAVIKGFLEGTYTVNVINTLGSVDNIKKINSGECDIAIVQSDALFAYEKDSGAINGSELGSLYREYAHLICRRDTGIDEISDLNEKTKVMIGKEGSGSQVTWRGMVLADKEEGGDDYSKIPVVYADSIVKLNAGDAACMITTATPGHKSLSVDAEKFGDKLVLVPIEDKDFNDITVTDSNGNVSSVYNEAELPYSSYKKLMPTGALGRKDVATFSVTAKVIISEKAENEKPEIYDAVGMILPDVQKILVADKGVVIE